MKIAIIGTGRVGLVTGACFAEKGHQVICIDNNLQKIDQLKKGKVPFYEPGLQELVSRNCRKKRLIFSSHIKDAVNFSEIIFITVGTPLTENGAADLSDIESVCYEIAQCLKILPKDKLGYRLIVEKSTVPVETGEKIKNLIKKYAPQANFEVASNPEFLQEGCAIKTTLYPDRIIVGVESKQAESIMRQLYASFQAPLVITDIKSAELIKHASNSFLAMKISFINAIARICDLVKADVTEVARGMGLDHRIGQEFLKAGIGYGGSCLPKDIAAFSYISRQLGYQFELLNKVQEINNTQIDYFIDKIKKELRHLKDKVLALWGLSFKPNTDDIRESPAIKIALRLIKEGAKLKVYDPKAMKEARTILGKSVRYAKSAYEAVRKVEALVIATDWEEFRQINLLRVKKLMLHPLIFDGRNIFDPKTMKELGYTYHCIGRP